jgi:pimeloyl-ACP methyl ester carboxylesterase
VSQGDERTALVIRLGDGRELGYAEWGAVASDTVVFDFHGGPGCRLSISGDVQVIARSGVRWITVDRPGLGLSWPQPGRTVADFAADVEELADHLEVDRFRVVGWSMGGPYAAAVAARVPQRVVSTTLLAPAPVYLTASDGAERTGKAFAWVLARDDPWQLCELYTALGLEARRNPAAAVHLFAGSSDGLSPREAATMARPDVADEFIEVIIEATRQGAYGLVDDMRVELAPWGFDLGSIEVPVSLWQGDEDSFVGSDSPDEWARAVPGLVIERLAGEGHLFPFEHTETLLATL